MCCWPGDHCYVTISKIRAWAMFVKGPVRREKIFNQPGDHCSQANSYKHCKKQQSNNASQEFGSFIIKVSGCNFLPILVCGVMGNSLLS